MAAANPGKKCSAASAAQPGSFEFLEDQLHALDHQAKGHAFEKLCRQFLKNAPAYRGRIKAVWPFREWPYRWSGDLGTDIIVETVDNEIWAVQAKALRCSIKQKSVARLPYDCTAGLLS